jgi:hypothetical protein
VGQCAGDQLFQGHADSIALELNQAAQNDHPAAKELAKQAGYFLNNRRRMNYHEMREAGWLIGSGMVESGAEQSKARFTGPGSVGVAPAPRTCYLSAPPL